jgi:SAM-dependent methyltransferase
MSGYAERQHVQEMQYAFPYHHLVEYSHRGISLTRQWAWALNYLGRLELVHRALDGIKFESLVDIGCGDGKLIASLCSEFKTKSFHGIDYSQQAILLANGLCRAPNAKFSVRDIVNQPPAEDRFDVATLIEVVEHIPPAELPAFLAAAKQTLRPGGYLICTTPSTVLPLPRKHFQHFTMKQLVRLFEDAGFDVETKDHIDGRSVAFSAARRLFANRFYCVTSGKLQGALFRLYKKLCLRNQGEKGEGLYLVARARA